MKIDSLLKTLLLFRWIIFSSSLEILSDIPEKVQDETLGKCSASKKNFCQDDYDCPILCIQKEEYLYNESISLHEPEEEGCFHEECIYENEAFESSFMENITLSMIEERELNQRKREKNAPILSSFKPGDLTVWQNGLWLSTGLRSIVTAYSGKNLRGSKFLDKPDAAATFPLSNGGWAYLVNSESKRKGGVGMITFNNKGNIIKYEMLLKGTSRNCGGGKTPWNTWISCEEVSNGHCYEVDPYKRFRPTKTRLGAATKGGKFESAACDNRDKNWPHFFVTEDCSCGALRRFMPNKEAARRAIEDGDYSKILTTSGSMHYLVLKPSNGERSGSFYWTSNVTEGRKSASRYYPDSEGIDVHDGKLYFVSKSDRALLTIDLDKNTYTRSSTNDGVYFKGQPDQIVRADEGLLYFTEDTKKYSGIHAMNAKGDYFTIVNAKGYNSETTGLAFSPDYRWMYFCIQSPGKCFKIYRQDGGTFEASTMDVRYHDRIQSVMARIDEVGNDEPECRGP